MLRGRLSSWGTGSLYLLDRQLDHRQASPKHQLFLYIDRADEYLTGGGKVVGIRSLRRK